MPTLAEIASLLGCPCPPNAADVLLNGVATLDEADGDDLSLVATDAFIPQLATSRAGAVLVQRKIKLAPDPKRPALEVDDVDLSVAKVLPLFAPPVPQPAVGVDPSARVAASASIPSDARIGANVFIGERVQLGARCVIQPNVYVGDDVVIGDDGLFFPNVVIRERIQIGNRVTIHAGSILGSDGFGYRWDGQRHAKIPQIGTVILEDDVEIGSCVCVDRAKFSTTRIGRGAKIDNLVQIGHNAQVGPHCILVGQSGLAGSVRLGTGVIIGGQTAVRDHVRMGDGAMAAACSGVAEDVAAKTIVSGTPAIPHRQSLREQAALRKLPDLVVQIRKLQEQIDELKRRQDSPSPPTV